MLSLKLATGMGVSARVPGTDGSTSTPTPGPTGTVTAMLMGQSEMEHLLGNGAFYRQIEQPVPGEGNLVVFTQDGPGAPPIRTAVDAGTVAAGQVNPAMAALSALLHHAAPGVQFVIGDGAVGGTSRRALADDTTDAADNRLWADFANVADAIKAEFGPVGHLVECWYNSDAAYVADMRANFWPFYFGAHADGSPFILGDTVNGRQVDHCLWDASAAPSETGRGLFSRNATQWHLLTPMPFLDAPVAPDAELVNFSANGARLSEPVRANLLALADDGIARSVGIRIGPSAHLCRFGGAASTQIHPDVGHPDGTVLMAWPIAVALLRASGMTIGEPANAGIEGPADGSYADLLVDLPNGGDLTTLAALRGTVYAGNSPHQQDVTGIEIARAGGSRRPVFRMEEADYPASHRGTVVIIDSGSGAPRRGRIRVTPEKPFAFGDSISLLRGQSTAALLEPRDLDLYPWFPMEHVPALYDAGATYPCEGLAVAPCQTELAAPVAAPSFQARGAYFDGASYYASSSVSVPAGDRGMVSLWFRSDDATWNNARRTLLQLRVSYNIQLDLYTSTAGRMAVRLYNDVSTLDSFFATPDDDAFVTGRYYHLAIAWAPGGAGIYVDGMPVLTLSFTDVDMAGEIVARIGIGSEVTGGTPWLGDIGHFYLNLSETLDLSAPANLAKFIIDGSPANLGPNGQLPTGNAPEFYYDGDAPAWANQGTAGNVSLTGAFTASDPMPGLAR